MQKILRVKRQGGDDDPETDQVDEYGEADDAQLGFFISHVDAKLPGGIRKGNPKTAPLNGSRIRLRHSNGRGAPGPV